MSEQIYAIAIHGGAGVIEKNLDDDRKEIYLQGLEDALDAGLAVLKNGGTSLDAVETAVRALEDNHLFNAGKGAVYAANGSHEMDASIMDGKTKSCGAVSGISNIKNPVTLARRVMEKTPHIMLISKDAEAFAAKVGVETAPSEYFHDERRYKQFLAAREEQAILTGEHTPLAPHHLRHSSTLHHTTTSASSATKEPVEDAKGTVGAVALDIYGNLAAATSTGGTTNKMPGRVGDSPIIGAGVYANNATCAVSTTGLGEQFMRHVVAYDVSARMSYGKASLSEATRAVVFETLDEGDGGLIAVDHQGNVELQFNSSGMFRGMAKSNGEKLVRIWEN